MVPTYAYPTCRQDGNHAAGFDLYEIHEAFAAQVLCTLKAGNRRKLAARGSAARRRSAPSPGELNPKAAASLPAIIRRYRTRIVGPLETARPARVGPRPRFVCTAGGMGVTAILER